MFRKIIGEQTIVKKEYNDTQILIKGSITFTNGFILDFMELKNTKNKTKIKYKYHFMNTENEMQFRYDNAKHHPEIKTFPHHKHISNIVVKSEKPELFDVLAEIQDCIL